MGQTLPPRVSNRSFAELRLDGARFQIVTLENLTAVASCEFAALESCASSAIDQMLQAIDATLLSFNEHLPSPLPPSRVNRRNLRAEFQAVGGESQVLRELETAARPNTGWLWHLEHKHSGSSFARLLEPRDDTAGVAMLHDPLDPGAGVELETPTAYLRASVVQVDELIDRMNERMADDVASYRDSERQQSRRII